jgi:hypothetical protein
LRKCRVRRRNGRSLGKLLKRSPTDDHLRLARGDCRGCGIRLIRELSLGVGMAGRRCGAGIRLGGADGRGGCGTFCAACRSARRWRRGRRRGLDGRRLRRCALSRGLTDLGRRFFSGLARVVAIGFDEGSIDGAHSFALV